MNINFGALGVLGGEFPNNLGVLGGESPKIAVGQ